ncbi:MAG: AAA family ATPase [Clostridiales bacterium]|nr:AAA family ATPase [Clostridiales bacterium]
MNIKRAKQEIKDTVQAYLLKDDEGEYVIPSIRQRPVLLMGPPGVGKTQIMEQAARECGIGLVAYTITHHTRQSAVGLPFIEKKQYGGREYTVTEYTMSEIVASIYDRIEETGLKEGILFIDEINCVSETLAPAMLQFLQCKTFGSHKIPEGWIIAAAGNPPEYNKSVREFDVVTLDRIKKILVEPDLGVWKEYARKEHIHPAVISYLGIRESYFCRIETTVDGKLFATPRGWEDLSQLIQVYERLGKKADREVIFQYIQHPKIAKDFANYLELYYKYQDEYQVEQILEGVIRESLCDQVARAAFDERLSVEGLLLAKLSEGFGQLFTEYQVMELVMRQLKAFQQEEQKEDSAAAFLKLAEGFEEERLLEKKRGLLGRQEDKVRRLAAVRLEGMAGLLRSSGLTDKTEAWQCLRERFMEDSDRYEEQKEQWGRRLEYAFDFMEAAFGSGQELVIFVTELNTSQVCIWFLEQYECERYFRYNKELLFEEEEREIGKVLER